MPYNDNAVFLRNGTFSLIGVEGKPKSLLSIAKFDNRIKQHTAGCGIQLTRRQMEELRDWLDTVIEP